MRKRPESAGTPARVARRATVGSRGLPGRMLVLSAYLYLACESL